MLAPRTEVVLKSIVEQYITKAIPVPSQSIVDDYNLGVSSATIRNEMARLEEEGYIVHTHISSGRIPSDKGYRYYVESLRNVELPLNQQRMISHQFHQVETRIDEWLSLTATLLAHLAQSMAVAALPKPAKCQFKHLELVPIQDSTALIVLVLRGAKIKQQLITFNQSATQPELATIVNKLNSAYSGLVSQQISKKRIKLSTMEQEVVNCVLNIMQDEDKRGFEGSYLDGLHFMFNQPEFNHARHMQSLVELTEQKNILKVIFPKRLASRGVQVFIGKENDAEIIHNYSVVISQYGIPEEAVGSIAIVGPTRMLYARNIAAIDYLSSLLTELVAKLYEEETLLS